MFIRKKSLVNLVGLLGKLCLTRKDMQQAEFILHKLPNIDVPNLLNLTKVQRVTPQVYHNLQTLKSQGFNPVFLESFLSTIQPVLERKKKYISQLFADLEVFAEKAESTGSRFIVIKGACFQNLYPSESWRELLDIDLVISQESGWKGIDAFKQFQYYPKRIRVERYPYSEGGSVDLVEGTFGVAEMLGLDRNPRAYPFDLHLGGFPGCGDGLLELNLWKRAIPFQVGNQEILMPSLEDCILIICSHTSRHGYAKLRDLNDIHVCLKQAEGNLDWHYLSYFSRKNSLQTILYSLLDRLKRDSEVEIPWSFLSTLKPKGLEHLTSKAMFSAGRENPNFHGRRQLILGRFLQTTFLYNYYRYRAGRFTAFQESLRGLYYLFQSGRPYRIWKKREIQSFRSNRRLVMIPIEAATEKVYWCFEQVYLQKVEQFALKIGVSIEWINNEIIIWNVGHPDEIILTPQGFYTQSAYNGNIDGMALERIQRIACEVAAQLKQTEAIQAKCVEAYRAPANVSVKC